MVPSIELSPQGPLFSRLVAGVMTWGQWGRAMDTAAMEAMVHHCLSLGITTFDHADIYGDYTTEEEFGRVIGRSPGLRQQLQLLTKCGIRLVGPNKPAHRLKSYDTSKAHIVASAEQSLRNLRTDYIDLLLIHRPDPLMDPQEIAEAVQQLQQQGKILHFGVSNFSPQQLQLLRAWGLRIVTNQVECSLVHRQPLYDGTLDQCMEMHIRPMAWSPVGGSHFFKPLQAGEQRSNLSNYLSEKAAGAEDVLMLAWLLKHPSGILPVLGTTRAERLTAAARAFEWTLSREEWFELLEVATGRHVP